VAYKAALNRISQALLREGFSLYDRLMKKLTHRISNVDAINRLGDCEVCGRVRIKPKQKGKKWACIVYEREYSGAGYKRRKLGYRVNILAHAEKIKSLENKCEICGTLDFGLVVDHDHSTGKFRGLLCNPCNKALGFFRDNPEVLESAARYIRERIVH